MDPQSLPIIITIGGKAVHLQLGGDHNHPYLHHRRAAIAGAEALHLPGHLQERGFLQHGFFRRQHHDRAQHRSLLGQLLCLAPRVRPHRKSQHPDGKRQPEDTWRETLSRTR